MLDDDGHGGRNGEVNDMRVEACVQWIYDGHLALTYFTLIRYS